MNSEEIKDLKEKFIMLDKNHKGELSVQDFKEEVSRSQFGCTQYLKKVIDSVDTDGGGTIGYTEFLAASIEEQHYLHNEAKMREAFNLFDTKKDTRKKGDKFSFISAKELKEVLGQDDFYKDKLQNEHEDFWDGLIASVDPENKGFINY